MYQEGYFMCVV